MTYYTASPTADYESYSAAQEVAHECQEAKTADAVAIIQAAFETQTAVPYVQIVGLGGDAKLRYQPFSEAAGDVIGYDEVWTAFLDTLKTSECPKVKNLVKVMANRYSHMNADDIGGVL